MEFDEKIDIISDEFCKFIRHLHSIHPSGSGCFIDYLLRRAWAEMIGVTFDDERAKYTVMCVKGWSSKVEKELFSEAELEDETQVVFPSPYIESYNKVLNNQNKTIDIISDIFVVSLAHNYFFNEYDEEFAQQQLEYVKKNFNISFMTDIQNIINIFPLHDKISLNPTLGGCGISADADLIIGANMIDFKVSKYHNTKYELFQLLGYSALAYKRGHFIEKIHIINPYLNCKKTLDIARWTPSQRDKYLEYIGCSITNTTCPLIEFCKRDKEKRAKN